MQKGSLTTEPLTSAESVAEKATAGGPKRFKSFHGSVEVNPTTAKVRMVNLADEIIAVLASDPQANLRITVEMNADFPSGAL